MAVKSGTQAQASQVAPNNSQGLPDLKTENIAPAEQVVGETKSLAVPLVDALERLVGANLTKN
jgi:hypothetical protein